MHLYFFIIYIGFDWDSLDKLIFSLFWVWNITELSYSLFLDLCVHVFWFTAFSLPQRNDALHLFDHLLYIFRTSQWKQSFNSFVAFLRNDLDEDWSLQWSLAYPKEWKILSMAIYDDKRWCSYLSLLWNRLIKSNLCWISLDKICWKTRQSFWAVISILIL